MNDEININNYDIAIFDFDGTISSLRYGWENVMKPVMLECIYGEPPYPNKLIQEIDEYIECSTGTQTIFQMQWLADKVKEYDKNENGKDAFEYKKIYNEKLLLLVNDRINKLATGISKKTDFLVYGIEKFLAHLFFNGMKLYVFSGTDTEDVINEAKILGVYEYFEDRIYGAEKNKINFSKKILIEDILNNLDIAKEKIIIFGDGPVEIKLANEYAIFNVGIASCENGTNEINRTKYKRLKKAGASFIIPNFEELI